MDSYNRRLFIKAAVVSGVGLHLMNGLPALARPSDGKRVGIIGLDTSHSIAFTKALNAASPDPVYDGYKVVAAYPHGSKDIESSAKRIPGYTEEVKNMGVEITGSIKELLSKVDVVLLETNDGRLHLEQALEVFKAGKRMFIDKPVAGSLSDAIAIYEASKKYNIPVFSASSLRYIKGIESIDKAKVVGADTYSPAVLVRYSLCGNLVYHHGNRLQKCNPGQHTGHGYCCWHLGRRQNRNIQRHPKRETQLRRDCFHAGWQQSTGALRRIRTAPGGYYQIFQNRASSRDARRNH